MRLSVAICTWNRAQLLDQTLRSMYSLNIPEHIEWELLVVNNNCTDSTDEIISRNAGHLPIRRLYEPKPGKSNALNLAVREVRGDYILWTDDDALVDPMWLKSYCEAFARWPDVAVFGGPVRPWFDGQPPDWLRQVIHVPQIATAYALRDCGSEPVQMSENTLPFGVNMAVRADFQAQYLYDTQLGPRPNSAIRGEEVAVVRQMLRDGLAGRWNPGAAVHHFIPRQRQTTQYLLSYFRGAGECRILMANNCSGPGCRTKWFPLLLAALQEDAKYRIRRMTSKPEKWINNLIRSGIHWGRLFGVIHGLSAAVSPSSAGPWNQDRNTAHAAGHHGTQRRVLAGNKD
jgi:glucosyl-dolichyl phosphate glucuronosyltransferase